MVTVGIYSTVQKRTEYKTKMTNGDNFKIVTNSKSLIKKVKISKNE